MRPGVSRVRNEAAIRQRSALSAGDSFIRSLHLRTASVHLNCFSGISRKSASPLMVTVP
jgi:hypothetical protein